MTIAEIKKFFRLKDLAAIPFYHRINEKKQLKKILL